MWLLQAFGHLLSDNAMKRKLGPDNAADVLTVRTAEFVGDVCRGLLANSKPANLTTTHLSSYEFLF